MAMLYVGIEVGSLLSSREVQVIQPREEWRRGRERAIAELYECSYSC